MISAAHPVASWFLLLASVLFLVVFVGPIVLAPLRWARMMGWSLPEDTNLTAYFGRCLGAAALAIVYVMFRAAPAPEDHALVFELVIVTGASMTAVHTWGALRRAQPWTEDAEIILYGGLTVLAWWLQRGVFG
jgi:hypothetical protein